LIPFFVKLNAMAKKAISSKYRIINDMEKPISNFLHAKSQINGRNNLEASLKNHIAVPL